MAWSSSAADQGKELRVVVQQELNLGDSHPEFTSAAPHIS